MTLHGDTRIDNYFWLRDDNRADPDVLDYLHQENDYGKSVMDSQRDLQERVLKEIIDRIPQREESAPYTKNGYRYRQVYEPGCEYAIYQRQSVQKGEWESWDLLLDANQRAAHSEFYTLGGLTVSPDNDLLAITEDLSFASPVRPAFLSICVPGTGIQKCWRTSLPASSGSMIPNALLCS
jgi:Protease II